LRLALYLDSVGQTPNVSGETYPERINSLMGQFQRLSAEQRKEARLLAKVRIRQCGDLDAAASYLVPTPGKAVRHEMRLQKRREKPSQWPLETPACPQCKVRGFDIPKRFWHSQEMADSIRLSLRDPLMVTYACPVQPGYFHLGHRRVSTLNPDIKTGDKELHES
jgi:hypothetical protein